MSAAIELFDEQGYEATTVAEIAERAGLTKRTFFRYFSDKREVLFSGSNELQCRWLAGVVAAPADATPLTVVAAGLDPQRPGQGHVGGPMADQPVPVCHEPPSRWGVLTGSVLGAVVAVTPLRHAVLVRDVFLRHAGASASVPGV